MRKVLGGSLALGMIFSATIAGASSEDAWETFRADVADACRSLLENPDATLVEVNQFGSESYGVAILLVSQNDAPPERLACVYDKKTGAAELTAPFGLPAD
jgi:hypothetical protein